MRTPASRTVMQTVTIDARPGAALRRSARMPSPMKKKNRPMVAA